MENFSAETIGPKKVYKFICEKKSRLGKMHIAKTFERSQKLFCPAPLSTALLRFLLGQLRSSSCEVSLPISHILRQRWLQIGNRLWNVFMTCRYVLNSLMKFAVCCRGFICNCTRSTSLLILDKSLIFNHRVWAKNFKDQERWEKWNLLNMPYVYIVVWLFQENILICR